jgi:hypothetical protein
VDQSEQGVEVRRSEVCVQRDDRATPSGNGRRDSAADQRLPDPTLAATEGEHQTFT